MPIAVIVHVVTNLFAHAGAGGAKIVLAFSASWNCHHALAIAAHHVLEFFIRFIVAVIVHAITHFGGGLIGHTGNGLTFFAGVHFTVTSADAASQGWEAIIDEAIAIVVQPVADFRGGPYFLDAFAPRP